MTPEAVADRYLSLRCWLQRSALPAAVAVVAFLLLIQQFGADERTVNHSAALIGFAGLYFVLFRGGHILMIRSLHGEMMKKHQEAYRKHLAMLTEGEIKRSNVGFTLARMKRDILVEARKKPDLGLKR